MDDLLRIFLTWQFMFFCLGLAAITFVIRRLIEFFILDNPKLPGNRYSLFWRSVLLPIAPVINGGISGYLAKAYPYPEGLTVSSYGRISFGLVAGLFSGLVYRVIAELLRSKMAQGNTPGTYIDPSLINPLVQSVNVSINKDPTTTIIQTNTDQPPVIQPPVIVPPSTPNTQ